MRFSIALLIIILLPFVLVFTDISYGSVVTESNINTRMMMKETIVTAGMTITDDEGNTETLKLPETPKSPSSIPSNLQLNKLMMKERVMTPEMNDEVVIEILELPETPLSPAFITIDYHFTEDIRLEKNYIRSLNEMKLNNEMKLRNEME